MWWKIGLIANAVVACAYLMVVFSIMRPLVQGKQLRRNLLAAATAAIFFTCAVHHGSHVVHMLLPDAGIERTQGLAMRTAYDWEAAYWDVITALAGAYYWTLRGRYGSLIHGAQLFEDMRQREKQALELNDAVLQGMVVAKLALDLGEQERARSALDSAIGSASKMISDLLGPPDGRGEARLLRSQAATLDERS